MSPPAKKQLWLVVGDGRRPPPEPTLDDAQLLAALRAGDPGAATSVHDRVRRPIDRTLVRLLGAGDVDREDLAQLAFIELVTTIDRFRGECSLDAWASVIAARIVYKHLRRRQTERRLFAQLELGLDRPASKDTRRDAIARSLALRLRGHLEALDSNKAWTFVLHDVLGHDLREIAEITGASVAAAQTRLTRGRRELHERIAADPELVDWLEGLSP
jgi:RNA polymerase sigma-70 factor (ECF subfamily)